MAVLTVQRPANEVLFPRLGARTHLEYTWAHAVKVHTVPPCEVHRGAPAPSPAVRAEGPHLPAPSPWVEPGGPHRPRQCWGRSAPAVEVLAPCVAWAPTPPDTSPTPAPTPPDTARHSDTRVNRHCPRHDPDTAPTPLDTPTLRHTRAQARGLGRRCRSIPGGWPTTLRV